MELIIGIVVGIIIGLVVGTLIFRRRYIPVGDLRIDRSDPTSEPLVTRACTMAVTITRTRITVRSTSTTTERRTRTTTSAVASLLSHRLTLHLVVGVPHPFYIARLTAQHLLKKSRQDTA